MSSRQPSVFYGRERGSLPGLSPTRYSHRGATTFLRASEAHGPAMRDNLGSHRATISHTRLSVAYGPSMRMSGCITAFQARRPCHSRLDRESGSSFFLNPILGRGVLLFRALVPPQLVIPSWKSKNSSELSRNKVVPRSICAK